MADGADIPPGWYPRPNNPAEERYWAGSAWTDNVRHSPDAEPTSMTRPTRRRRGGHRWPTRGYIASGLLLVVVAVLVFVFVAGNKSSNTAMRKLSGAATSQYLSPMAYKAYIGDRKAEATTLVPCSSTPPNPDVQTLAIIKVCNEESYAQKHGGNLFACFPLVHKTSSVASLRNCQLVFFRVRNRQANNDISYLSQVLAALLPGKCKTEFQLFQQKHASQLALNERFTPKIAAVKSRQELLTVYQQWIHAFAASASRYEGEERKTPPQTVCHP